MSTTTATRTLAHYGAAILHAHLTRNNCARLAREAEPMFGMDDVVLSLYVRRDEFAREVDALYREALAAGFAHDEIDAAVEAARP